jgi:hypothetical protein
MLPNQVISCDIDTVFSGTLELNMPYDKNGIMKNHSLKNRLTLPIKQSK